MYTHRAYARVYIISTIISESMRRIKNMFRQKLCDIEGDIRWTLGDVVKVRAEKRPENGNLVCVCVCVCVYTYKNI